MAERIYSGTWVLLSNLKFALRQLRRSPSFTAATLLTLALVIGINAAVFSVVDNVFLRPLPYPRPDQLAVLAVQATHDSEVDVDTSVDGRTWEAFRDAERSFETAVYSGWATGVNLMASSGALYAQQIRVGAGFFRVLGVTPRIGRDFLAEEDRSGGPAVAVLSYELWKQHFGSDEGVVGTTIMLRGEPTTVVGVLPPSQSAAVKADLFTPLRPTTVGEGEGTNYQVIVRIPENSSWARARAETQALGAADLASRERQPTGKNEYLLLPMQEALGRDLARPLFLLWGAVAVVLLIASVNIAALLMARGRRRQAEFATRTALGGGRAAIVSLLLTESIVLGVLGGVLGLVTGGLFLRALLWLSRDALPLDSAVHLDLRVAAATLLLSLVTALLFGLVPSLQAGQLGAQASQLGGSRTIAGGSGSWSRRLLVVGEVGLAVVLLFSAGLLVRTFLNLDRLEPGFDPEPVTTARVSLQDAPYRDHSAMVRLLRESTARLEALPGVEAAAVSLGLPYERLLNLGFQVIAGGVTPSATITSLTYITPHYFDTMNIPIRNGRAFDERDSAEVEGVAIVNETFVRSYFEGIDPLGWRIATAGRERRIVGVSGDVQQQPGWGDFGPLAPMPLVYIPAEQTDPAFLELVHTWFTPAWSVRANGRRSDLAPLIKKTILDLDPQLPVAEVTSMSAVSARSLAPQRFLMTLVLSLGLLALLLAALGVHALISSSVAERFRETGIRIALGATAAQAMGRLALQGVVLTACGLVFGGVAATFAARWVGSLLWGVDTHDPATLMAVATTLLATALVSSVLPGLRVLRQEPAQTLRQP